jgi:hypothetical protein
MKRNMDLVRKILLEVERSESGYAPQPLKIRGYSDDLVGYHALIMWEAGLVEGVNAASSSSGGTPAALITRLTWQGHELLDAARQETRWKKAKSILKKVGGATLQIWLAVLTNLIKDEIAG